jgi:hypothetical protein
MSQPLVAGTTSSRGGGYEGVLRRGRRVLFRCGHHHNNRDTATVRGRSARECITLMLGASRNRGLLREEQARIKAGPLWYAHFNSVPERRLRRLKEDANEAGDMFAERVRQLATLVGDEPVYGHGGEDGQVILTPPPPHAPCPRCGTRLIATRWTPKAPDGADWRGWQPDPGRAGEWPRCSDGSRDHSEPEG